MGNAVEPARLDALLDRARRDVDDGLVPACQVAVAQDGELVCQATFGAPEGSRFHGYSSGKAVVASAVWLLLGDGALSTEDLVADHIPEFATNGKEAVTVEQVLLHTSGFPHAPFNALEWEDREARLGRFSSWRLNWEPGTRFEYHATSAHWVLAELIERRAGQDWRTFVRERVLDPLGLAHLRFGVPPEEQGDVLPVESVGATPTSEELEALTGIAGLDLAQYQGEVTDDALLSFNRPELRAVGVPGGGVITTAGDLALFYQGLLHDPKGLWDADVLADATGRVRCAFPDNFTGVPVNRTIGVVVAGDDEGRAMRGLGRTVSARAFGHDGAGGQVAWG
ncbi:MAG TPA: serine hydrolase domain-containing protein, partial [Acidimicrobiales bacterium]|nr:serine hydrolase domain-containing protein [Acidimicrobiales bacterium]